LAYATAHLRDRLWIRIALVLAVAVGYGVAIELLQGLHPDRHLSAADALANVAGALLASGWFLLESRIRYRRLRRLPSP
jgi:VanZ family protein